jgi:hypothetical protein
VVTLRYCDCPLTARHIFLGNIFGLFQLYAVK